MKKNYSILIALVVILFSNASIAQTFYPGGDSCEAAVPITPGDGYYTVLDGPGTDHWYSFIAPCDGDLVVSNAGPNESDKRIYSGVCGSLLLEAESSWAVTETVLPMFAGESVKIVVNDSWDGEAQFSVEFDDCVIDSADLDISGTVYLDLNENGVQDLGEQGIYLASVFSDPSGVLTFTNSLGFYYSPVADLPDGVYEIHPEFEYWGITSDSLFYTINVDDLYEQRDSLDFGLYPDTLVYEVDVDLIGALPRCNDTINYWINIRNTGSTIASGLVDLELDDSLFYISANILPDSVEGRHVYWNYEDLFYFDNELIILQLATPDGEADTILSNVTVTVDSADIEMFTTTETLEQIVLCAFDPNDKTPSPLGEGEFGYISPETESIEYLIRFQNTGTDTAINVVIKDQLDENLDWYSITPLAHSHYMRVEMDLEGEVSFIFDNIMLPDSNVNVLASQGYVKYRIDLKPGLPLGTSILNTAYIYFDLNPAVITNTTVNTLFLDDSGIDEVIKDHKLLVYPNPFSEITTVYFENDLKDYSVEIVDLLGKQVYANNQLSGNKLEVEARDFKAGMYVLLLIDNKSNEVVSNAKLIVK